MKRKYMKTLRGVRIPTWALCYLVNSDGIGLDADDMKTADEWVERTRNGGRIYVSPSYGEPYFTSYPAFGLACDVEDCDVVVDMTPWYQQNPCIRFGQSRFGPLKRTAPDGKVWWCIYDYHDNVYVAGYRFKKRRPALVQLAMDLRSKRLPYEPDPGFSPGWLRARTAMEVADLADKREPAWLEKSLDDMRRVRRKEALWPRTEWSLSGR